MKVLVDSVSLILNRTQSDGTQQSPNSNPLISWMNNIVLSNGVDKPDYLVLFDLNGKNKADLLETQVNTYYQYKQFAPTQPSMILFSRNLFERFRVKGPEIGIFSHTPINATNVKFIPLNWGSTGERMKSRSIVLLSTDDGLTMAVFQTNESSCSEATQTSRIIGDCEAASILHSIAYEFTRFAIFVNIPGDIRTCSSIERLSMLLNKDYYEDEGSRTVLLVNPNQHNDITVFDERSKIYQVGNPLGRSTNYHNVASLSLKNENAILMQQYNHDFKKLGYCIGSLFLIYLIFAFLKKLPFIQKISKSLYSPYKNSNLYLYQRNHPRTYGAFLKMIRFEQFAYRRVIMSISSLIVELSLICATLQVFSGTGPKTRTFAQDLYQAGIYNFYYTRLQYLTYPLFILFHIFTISLLIFGYSVHHFFFYLYSPLAWYWSIYFIIQGGDPNNKNPHYFSIATLALYIYALVFSFFMHFNYEYSRFALFLFPSVLICYLVNTGYFYWYSTLRWHYYHILMLYPIVYHIPALFSSYRKLKTKKSFFLFWKK